MTRPFSSEELCAAFLADPQRKTGQDLPWSSCDVRALLQVFQKNKVPLLSLADREGSAGLLSEPLLLSARQREADKLTDLRAEYKKVKDALTGQVPSAARDDISSAGTEGAPAVSSHIEDALIKSVGRAPSFPYTSDNLDVLYRPEDIEKVKTVLRTLGYVELKNVEEPHKYLFYRFHAGRVVSAVHAHAHVGWMVSFLDEQALWPRRRASLDDSLVTILAPEDALLTTLAHCFYEDKRVSLWDVCKGAQCLRQGLDWIEVYRVATWRGWRDGLNMSLLLYAYQEDALYGETLVPQEILRRAYHELAGWARAWSERALGKGVLSALVKGGLTESQTATMAVPLRFPFALSKACFYAKLVRDPTRSAARKAKDLAVHTANGTKLRLRIHSQPAMLVSFSGVDGCGKTTQAKALSCAFEACHVRVHLVWTRGGSSRWLHWFARWGKRGSDAQTASTPPSGARGEQAQSTPARSASAMQDKVEARQRHFRSRGVRWGWSWLTTMELLLEYARRVALPLSVGRVVICDRYVPDAFADWTAYFRQSSVDTSLAARVLRRCSPRPRLAYWIDVTPETARSRSEDDNPIEFLTAQSDAYGKLSRLHALHTLDGARAWEAISDDVIVQALSTYFSTYHTLVNAVFLKNPGQWR
jgi:thymidylate kinase